MTLESDAETHRIFSNRTQTKNWIIAKISEYTEIPSEEINEDDTIESFGIDSAVAVTLTFDIEEALGVDEQIEPEILFEFYTVRKLTDFILTKCDAVKAEA